MSATAAPLPARVFESSLAELKRWREALAVELAALRRWATVERLAQESVLTRLAHFERRLSLDRLVLAFVAGGAQGSRELVNALFFADPGARLLPAAGGKPARCPAELLWDPSLPVSLRLLPIETRGDARALRELMDDRSVWKQTALDAAKPHLVAPACEALAETIEVPAAVARSFGLAVAGSEAVEIPRWRYAMLNFPHPLLESGIAVLDVPGRGSLEGEADLLRRRIPEAAALVFVLGAGLTEAGRSLWLEQLGKVVSGDSVFLVLDRLEALRGENRAEGEVLDEVDRQTRHVAEALGVAPTRIFALAARQGLLAKMAGDRDGVVKSRLYRLEHAIARGMVHQRRLDHATAAAAELRGLFEAARALIEGRISFANENREELKGLQHRNQKLVETLARKTAQERSRLERARAAMTVLRGAHLRRIDELERLLAPGEMRAAAAQAKAAMADSRFSSGIGAAIDAFFAQARARLERAVEIIEEVKSDMTEAKAVFAEQCGMQIEVQTEFGTGRFLAELERLEEQRRAAFTSAPSLLIQGRGALGARFEEEIAARLVHVFQIADREVTTWTRGFIRPLEALVNESQERINARIEGMGRMQAAESELVSRLEELDAYMKEMRALHAQCDAHERRLASLLAADEALTLA